METSNTSPKKRRVPFLTVCITFLNQIPFIAVWYVLGWALGLASGLLVCPQTVDTWIVLVEPHIILAFFLGTALLIMGHMLVSVLYWVLTGKRGF